MIGLVLATHGPLAEAFVSSGKLIVGNIGNVAHLGLFHGDSIEQFEHTRQSNRRMKGTV